MSHWKLWRRQAPSIVALPPASLLASPAGRPVRIERIPAELNCAQRLRELGIVEGAEVTLLRRSDPLLILAKESRIAIDLKTAQLIEVSQPLETAAAEVLGEL